MVTEAIDLTFTSSYRLDFLKAFCAVLRSTLVEAIPSAKSTNVAPVLWTTAWELDDSGTRREQPLFGLSVRDEKTQFYQDYPRWKIAIRFLGKRFLLEFRLNRLSKDARSKTKGSLKRAFSSLPKRLVELAPGLVCYWALNANGMLDGRLAIDDLISRHKSIFEIQLLEQLPAQISSPAHKEIRRTAGILKAELRSIDEQLELLHKLTSSTDNDDMLAGSASHTRSLQDHRPFLEFRRAYLDFFCIHLRGSKSSIDIKSFFFVYNPWSLTYSYRGLLPGDVISDSTDSTQEGLITALASVIASSLNSSPARENALARLEKEGANTAAHPGAAIARVLRDNSFILDNPLLHRFVKHLESSHTPLCLLVALIQSIEQPYDTGLIKEFHHCNDAIVITDSPEELVDRDSLTRHPRRAALDALDQLERYLLFKGARQVSMAQEAVWLALPLRAHHQQRGLWFIRIAQRIESKERKKNAPRSPWKRVLNVLRTAAPLVAGAFALRLDATVANQFQDRVFERLTTATSGRTSTDREEQLLAVAHALPSLFNTVLSAYLRIPLRSQPPLLDLDDDASTPPLYNLFFADDNPTSDGGIGSILFQERTRKLPPHEATQRVREILESILINGTQSLYALLESKLQTTYIARSNTEEFLGPFTVRFNDKSRRTLVSLCELKCTERERDDVWAYRFRPESLALWVQFEPSCKENRNLHCILVSLETPLAEGLAQAVAEERFRTIAEMLRVARQLEATARGESAQRAFLSMRHSLLNVIDKPPPGGRKELLESLQLERLSMDAALALVGPINPAKMRGWGYVGAGGTSFETTLENALSHRECKLLLHAEELDPETKVDPRFLGLLIELARNATQRPNGQPLVHIYVQRSPRHISRQLLDVELRTRCKIEDVWGLLEKLKLEDEFSGVSLVRQFADALRDPQQGTLEWNVSADGDTTLESVSLPSEESWCRVTGPSWALNQTAHPLKQDLGLTVRARSLNAVLDRS